MTNKELLEYAAKAGGIELHVPAIYSDAGGVYRQTHGWWTPLQDDGDALRLAVKLDMHVVRNFDFGAVCRPVASVGYSESERCMAYVHETIVDDPYFATRRAIVRAAAEIGKAMP